MTKGLGMEVFSIDFSLSFLMARMHTKDSPGSPVPKTALPMQGTRVGSLLRELDPGTAKLKINKYSW